MKKFILNTLAFVIVTFWLTPLFFGLIDVAAWILFARGVTGVDWVLSRVIVTILWVVGGLWVFGTPAIILSEEADNS